MSKLIPQQDDPLIFAVGGGKGGVGKSMVSSNLAVQYAQGGLKVIIIDLDIGAANLHTIYGMRQPPRGLGDYFTTPRSQLSDYVLETKVDNLFLIPGSGFVPELANLKHAQKVKIVNHIKNLKADLVLLDLGAGTSNTVVDFFSITHTGIIVTTPEPTAIVNAYEFIKNVIYRILFRVFRNQEGILEILKSSAVPGNEISSIHELMKAIAAHSPWAAENIKEICADLDFHLIFNQARKTADAQLGARLNEICQKFLEINLNFSGLIFFNEEVPASVFKMSPISIAFPESITSQTLKRLAMDIFNKATKKMTDSDMQDSFNKQYSYAMSHAEKDFELNYLTQRRLQRDQEKRINPVQLGIE